MVLFQSLQEVLGKKKLIIFLYGIYTFLSLTGAGIILFLLKLTDLGSSNILENYFKELDSNLLADMVRISTSPIGIIVFLFGLFAISVFSYFYGGIIYWLKVRQPNRKDFFFFSKKHSFRYFKLVFIKYLFLFVLLLIFSLLIIFLIINDFDLNDRGLFYIYFLPFFLFSFIASIFYAALEFLKIGIYEYPQIGVISNLKNALGFLKKHKIVYLGYWLIFLTSVIFAILVGKIYDLTSSIFLLFICQQAIFIVKVISLAWSLKYAQNLYIGNSIKTKL